MTLVGVLPFATFRHIIDTNKPYDKGYMFIFGNRYTQSNDYTRATYDLIAVPYIRYQEEGTKFFDGNKDFISLNTVSELNQAAAFYAAGVTNELVGFRDATRARSSMISNGVMEHIKNYGTEGGNYNAYINRS
jgi:hypothetical protein